LTNSPALIDLSLRAYRWFEDGMRTRLAARGWPPFSRSHAFVFAHLDGDGTRPVELARRIGVTRQAMHQTLAELAALGFVELVADPDSRRSKLVVVTPKGKEIVADARAIFAELEDGLALRLGRTHVDALRRVLEADWGPPLA
jgi:DNA-binding MarR family transcriptional regulator